MDSLRQRLRTLSSDLNDPRGDSWGIPDLLEYLTAGACLAMSLNPKRFATTITVPLVPGAQQKVDCGVLVGVVGVNTAAGLVEVSQRPVDSTAAAAFGRVAPIKADYFPTSIRLSDTDRESFFVNPPAPVGVSMTVSVSCAVAAIFTMAALDKPMTQIQCAQYEIVREWAMYRALASEIPAAAASGGPGAAAGHKQTFFQLVGAVLNSEESHGDTTMPQPRSNNRAS